jgi:hypothetical protein
MKSYCPEYLPLPKLLSALIKTTKGKRGYMNLYKYEGSICF